MTEPRRDGPLPDEWPGCLAVLLIWFALSVLFWALSGPLVWETLWR